MRKGHEIPTLDPIRVYFENVKWNAELLGIVPQQDGTYSIFVGHGQRPLIFNGTGEEVLAYLTERFENSRAFNDARRAQQAQQDRLRAESKAAFEALDFDPLADLEIKL